MFTTKLKTREVTINLYALSVLDVRNLLDVKKKAHDGDVILAKAISMTVDEIEALSYPEYRKLTRFFWQCVNDPLKDEDEEKNLPSGSTTE